MRGPSSTVAHCLRITHTCPAHLPCLLGDPHPLAILLIPLLLPLTLLRIPPGGMQWLPTTTTPHFTYGTPFHDLLPGPYTRGPFPPLPLPPLNPRDVDRPYPFPSADELRPPRWGRGRLCPQPALPTPSVPAACPPQSFGDRLRSACTRATQPSSPAHPYPPPNPPFRCIDRHPDDLRGTDLIFPSTPFVPAGPALCPAASASTSSSMPRPRPASSSSETWDSLLSAYVARIVIDLDDDLD